ncbi:MAG: nickel pincer cofactor biosynthesis protein LarB [Planctomycetia bacterium]|nr:nickel pincer cofactor biosynthesis protein LarB [Planctomycetia bacterium]
MYQNKETKDTLSTAELGFAQIDLAREKRCGFPEVVYAEGKTTEAVLAIFEAQISHGIIPYATRVRPEQMEALKARFPEGVANAAARTFRLPARQGKKRGKIAVVTAGTSDAPVAEEAKETALWMGAEVVFIQDVGVAGPHRLVEKLPILLECQAAVVVAGMEGALPSVVGGFVPFPIVAVPTSVGYGANFGGLSALLGMLNSCASNVVVVNIDSGFKGGYVAAMIASQSKELASDEAES